MEAEPLKVWKYTSMLKYCKHHWKQLDNARSQVISFKTIIIAELSCFIAVIAAVHGDCIGGGVDLITACDIRLCSADAGFIVKETKLALVADLGMNVH